MIDMIGFNILYDNLNMFEAERQGRRRRGGRGCPDPHSFYNRGFDPPEILRFFRFFFSNVCENLRNIYVYRIKWPKTEEKQNFWGRWFSGHDPDPPPDDPDPPPH